MKSVKRGASAKKPMASTGSSIGLSVRELATMDSTRLQAALAAYDAAMKRNWQEALPEVKAHLDWSKTWQKLNEAARDNEVEDLKALLPGFLRELGLKLPEGVIRAPRRRAGRPASDLNQRVYGFWVAWGRPKPSDFARKIYGKDFMTVGAADRKRMTDNCAVSAKRGARQNRG